MSNKPTLFSELKRRNVYKVAVAYVGVSWLLIQAASILFARGRAKNGETDRAIAALQKLLSIPGPGFMALARPRTPALLRLDPMFDPLRNGPRFQKLCEEPRK